MIVERDGKCFRVQVRYADEIDGRIQVMVSTSWSNSQGSFVNKFSKEKYDVLVIYCRSSDRLFYVPTGDINCVRVFTLRTRDISPTGRDAEQYATPQVAFGR
jgi:hypothetical protein